MKIYVYETEKGLLHPSLASDLEEILNSSGYFRPVQWLPIPSEVLEALMSWNGSKNGVLDIWNLLGNSPDCRIFIADIKGGHFNRVGLNACPVAAWGVTCSELIAIDYAEFGDKRANQLHECLHLFGVEDCYLEDLDFAAPEECNNEKCVMRYGNRNIGVCQRVMSAIRGTAEELREWSEREAR